MIFISPLVLCLVCPLFVCPVVTCSLRWYEHNYSSGITSLFGYYLRWLFCYMCHLCYLCACHVNHYMYKLSFLQFLNLLYFHEMFWFIDIKRRYQKYHPGVVVHRHAKPWWNFAITAVLECRIRPFSWSRIKAHRL